jgi:hypothetical protein
LAIAVLFAAGRDYRRAGRNTEANGVDQEKPDSGIGFG